MADVFISYAREDKTTAERLASALSAQGRSVWWDRHIRAGQTFDDAIERELDAARCAIVLWSAESVRSEWVKNEAAAALERGVLLPVRIADVRPPLEFRRRQTVDLLDWQGDPEAEGFQLVCAGIAGVLGEAVPDGGGALGGQDTGPRPTPGLPRWLIPGAVGLVVLLIAGWLSFGGAHRTETPSPPVDTSIPRADGGGSPAPAVQDLAARVAGRYSGDIVASAVGSSRQGVTVTVTRIDDHRVRVTGSDPRLIPAELQLSQYEQRILGESEPAAASFIVELDHAPPTLSFNPDGKVAFGGVLQAAVTADTGDGRDLREAQRLLCQLGYETGPTDGIAGPRSIAFIKTFQQSVDLTPTGIPDGRTLAAMRAAVAAKPAAERRACP